MTFAQTLKKLRTDAGLTQEQLAHACGYSGQSRIGNYESSQPKARQPKPDELPVIAKALGVSVGQLFGESQTLRLDPVMLAETHRVLRELYHERCQVYSLEDPIAAVWFVQLYAMRAAMSAQPSQDEWVQFGRKLATITTPQGAGDGRSDGVPVEGTGTKRVAGGVRRRKA
jgi:transcriptional regulator with XRE-family HTH domain